jgi:uncharacterized damage-inducible protein DinB
MVWTLLIAALMCVLAPVHASADAKSDMMQWIKDADSKINQLAAAMPESKYAWRPGKGVRSVGEVYMHVASANYGIPASWGATPPAGFDIRTYEKSLTTKADIQKALKESFASMEKNVEAMSDADMEKPVTLFGMQMTARGACLLLLSHCHEHLGQSIAYARMNKVTPPWSVEPTAAKTTTKKEGGK